MHRPETANVLVIGAGAAGSRAAIAATQAGVQARMLGKRAQVDAHTVLASGGINAALSTLDSDDSWQADFADKVGEGYHLGDPRMIEIARRDSPDAVLELAACGCPFERTEDGRLDPRFFGAHRWRRTGYAGDFTGRAILQTVARKVAEIGVRVEEGIAEVRTIEIVRLDFQAGGGTHVSRMSEIGRVRVTGYESKGRINKRIRITVEDA